MVRTMTAYGFTTPIRIRVHRPYAFDAIARNASMQDGTSAIGFEPMPTKRRAALTPHWFPSLRLQCYHMKSMRSNPVPAVFFRLLARPSFFLRRLAGADDSPVKSVGLSFSIHASVRRANIMVCENERKRHQRMNPLVAERKSAVDGNRTRNICLEGTDDNRFTTTACEPPAGVEPATCRLQGGCSSHLS